MNWKEFKDMVEGANVKDDCEIDFIGKTDFYSVDELEIQVDEKSNRCNILPAE